MEVRIVIGYLCFSIAGLIALLILCDRAYDRWLVAREKHKAFQVAKEMFDPMPDSWKDALAEIATKGSLIESYLGEETNAFKQCGFVSLDSVGRFYLRWNVESVRKLASEWAASRKN